MWRITSFCLSWAFQVLLWFDVPQMPYLISHWTALFPAPCLVHWWFYRLWYCLPSTADWSDPFELVMPHLEALQLLLFILLNVLSLFQFYHIISKLGILQLPKEFETHQGFIQWHCIHSFFFLSGLSFSPSNFSNCNSSWFTFWSLLSAELDFFKEGW